MQDEKRPDGAERRRFLKALGLLGLSASLSPAVLAAAGSNKARPTAVAGADGPAAVTSFLGNGKGAGLGDLSPASLAKTLSFEAPRTGEKLVQVPFWVDGEYEPDAIREISFLLRDWHTGEVKPIDPQLLDLLHTLQRKLGSKSPFQVISGYRSPKTNAKLRQRSRRVARNSLHMEGKAVDIRLPGVSARHIQRAALELGRGGVGYYPRRGFVHVDTGPVRRWAG